MAVNSDYYSMLGIDKSASADDIKRAYRKLALQYHPDRNKTKDAEEKFKEINRAYEVLGDPQKRQMYDQFGTAAFEGPAGPSSGPFGGSGQYGPFTYTYTTGGNGADFDFGGFSDPFDIFEQFFGGGFRQARRQVYSLVITFNEAVHGAQKEVTIDNKKQTIMIPAGVDSGSRIRFADYDVVIDVIPDKHFKREGVDVITEEEITFPQAVLGTQLQVKTINDNVKLRIPPGTQHGTLIRLSGKGFQRLRSTGHGDHYVKIKIIVPKNPNKRQKELLEEFDTLSGNKKWF